MNENIRHLREILEHATMHEPTRIEAMVCLDLLEADMKPTVYHDVDQYYPKDMTAVEAAKILLDAERTNDEEVCQECGVYPPDHKGVCEGCLAFREHTAT